MKNVTDMLAIATQLYAVMLKVLDKFSPDVLLDFFDLHVQKSFTLTKHYQKHI